MFQVIWSTCLVCWATTACVGGGTEQVAQSPPALGKLQSVKLCFVWPPGGLGRGCMCVLVAKSPAGLDAKIPVPKSDELKMKRLKVALYMNRICPLSWSTNNPHDWRISPFSHSWFIVWPHVCALLVVGRNISQNHFFYTCYLTRTHVENYSYTMTRHDDFIAWLRKSGLGDKSCLPQSVNWVKFLKPPVVSQPCSVTCPPQFQLSPSTCVYS